MLFKNIRQSKAGDFLLEVRAKPEERASFGHALQGVLREKGGARHLIPRAQLVVRDLAETTKVEVVQKALEAFLEEIIGSFLNINLTKRNNRGCMQAFKELEDAPAERLEKQARLNVE